jgi:hypothetical protein
MVRLGVRQQRWWEGEAGDCMVRAIASTCTAFSPPSIYQLRGSEGTCLGQNWDRQFKEMLAKASIQMNMAQGGRQAEATDQRLEPRTSRRFRIRREVVVSQKSP